MRASNFNVYKSRAKTTLHTATITRVTETNSTRMALLLHYFTKRSFYEYNLWISRVSTMQEYDLSYNNGINSNLNDFCAYYFKMGLISTLIILQARW